MEQKYSGCMWQVDEQIKLTLVQKHFKLYLII